MPTQEFFQKKLEAVKPEERLQVFQHEFNRVRTTLGDESKKMQDIANLTKAFIATTPMNMKRETAETVLKTIGAAIQVAKAHTDNFTSYVARNYNPNYWNTEDVGKAFKIKDEVQSLAATAVKALESAQVQLTRYLKSDKEIAGELEMKKSSRVLGPAPDLTPKQIAQYKEQIAEYRQEALAKGLSSALFSQDRLTAADRAAEGLDKTLQETTERAENTSKWGMRFTAVAFAVTGTWLVATVTSTVAGAAGVWGAASGAEAAVSDTLTEGKISVSHIAKSTAIGAVLGGLGAEAVKEIVKHSANTYFHGSVLSTVIDPSHVAYATHELTKVKLGVLATQASSY